MINRRADEEREERRADERERVRRDDARCLSLAAEYQGDYAGFGVEPPMARADEWSDDYERRLLRGLQRRLSPRSELAAPTLTDNLDGVAFDNFAKSIRAEAAREAATPSVENMADSVDDPRARRERVDPETNQRKIEWYAKRSFIADIAPPRVRAHIHDPRFTADRAVLNRGGWMTQSPR